MREEQTDGLRGGWHALTATGQRLAMALGAALPWLAALALLAIIPVVVIRKRKASRAVTADPGAPEMNPDGDE
ncbi:MAG: DUF4349 domain-containing protein [Cellulomonadaceae bacterium]|jgi:hypothetical protein|nr:DUF4349 domain-containing protein [Cellulomonadaceae bacterium]